MRELIALRERLQTLVVQACRTGGTSPMPDSTIRDAGASMDSRPTALKHNTSGEVFVSTKGQLLRNDKGDRVTPGFTVHVGLANFGNGSSRRRFRAPSSRSLCGQSSLPR